MSSHRPDQGTMSWAVSPTFRSGPRQTGHDQSAQEIIRFVRECQRADVKQAGASSVKRKTVLPAIGHHDNINTDTSNHLRSSDKPRGIVASKLNPEVNFDAMSYKKEFEFVKENDDNNCTTGSKLTDNIKALSVAADPEEINRSTSDMLEGQTNMRSLFRQAIISENDSPSSPSQRTWKMPDNLLLGASACYLTSNYLNRTSTAGNTQYRVTKSKQLPRPRVLPQLPSIDRNDLPFRPSAPSPSPASPSPASPSVSSPGSDYSQDFHDDLPAVDTQTMDQQTIDRQGLGLQTMGQQTIDHQGVGMQILDQQTSNMQSRDQRHTDLPFLNQQTVNPGTMGAHTVDQQTEEHIICH